MRTEAFSSNDRAAIIFWLTQAPEWEGTRGGCHVRLVRYRARTAGVIAYAVHIGRYWAHGKCNTVGEALDACNQLIAEAPVHGAAIKRAHCAHASQGGLFG